MPYYNADFLIASALIGRESTVADLIEATGLSFEAVRCSLFRLMQMGAVKSKFELSEYKIKYYYYLR